MWYEHVYMYIRIPCKLMSANICQAPLAEAYLKAHG